MTTYTYNERVEIAKKELGEFLSYNEMDTETMVNCLTFIYNLKVCHRCTEGNCGYDMGFGDDIRILDENNKCCICDSDPYQGGRIKNRNDAKTTYEYDLYTYFTFEFDWPDTKEEYEKEKDRLPHPDDTPYYIPQEEDYAFYHKPEENMFRPLPINKIKSVSYRPTTEEYISKVGALLFYEHKLKTNRKNKKQN